MRKLFPVSFESVAGLPPSLNVEESAALIEKTNLSDTAAFDKLNRFVRNTTGSSILCPKREMSKLISDIPSIKTITETVDCGTKKKEKLEKVCGVVNTLHEKIKCEIERNVCCQDKPEWLDTSFPTDQTKPMFSHNQDTDPDGVLGIFLFDHGQSFSQATFQLHLKNSQSRRELSDKTHGIIDIPFSTLKCSKENSNTLKLTTQSVNESIEWLSNYKLMCVSQGKRCKCFWMDKKATKIQMQENGCVTYQIDTFVHQIETNLYLEQDQPLKIFTVFESMSYLVVSDLAAMFALMGRENHSTNKCLKCNLKISEWKKDQNKKGKILSDEMLKSLIGKQSNKVGVKEAALLNVPAHRYICPLLHLLLGIVNDILSKGIVPLALRLDGCSDRELQVRAMLQEIESGERTGGGKTLKSELKKLIKKRTNLNVGTDTAIRDELTKSGLFFERYHGGTLTGNYCKKLCEEAEEMMKKCENICLGKIKDMQTVEGTNNLPEHVPSVEECQTLFGNLAKLLSMVDVVFADLNLLAPTTNEIDRVRKNLLAMEKLWNIVGLPWTPKVHLLFRHCVDDMERYGGLGDKVEQSIEKRHQLQVRMTLRLRTMRNVNDRLVKQYEYEWRASHPRVKQIITDVDSPKRVRKHSPTLTLKQENTNKRQKVKSLRRLEISRDIDSSLVNLFAAETLCSNSLCHSDEIGVNVNGVNANQQNSPKNDESTVDKEIES